MNIHITYLRDGLRTNVLPKGLVVQASSRSKVCEAQQVL